MAATVTTDFPEIFHTYIRRSIQFALERVQRSIGGSIPRADVDFALGILTYALERHDSWSLAYRVLLALVSKMKQAGYREECIAYLEHGIAQSRVLQQRDAEAELKLHLGLFYQLRGKYGTAYQYFKSSCDCFHSLGDSQGQARALNRLAYVARLMRQYDEAVEYVETALALLTENNPAREFSYFVQGAIALDRGDWADAATYFQRSLALCEMEGDLRLIAQRLGNLGSALRAQGRLDEAKTCFERAIALFRQVHDLVQQALMEMNLGNVYLLCGQPDLALQIYQSAEPILRSAQDELHLAMLYTNLGIAYRDIQQWVQAETALLSSIERWKQLGNVKSSANALDELGMVYLQQELNEQAVDIFRQALVELTHMKDEPGYTALWTTITTHLNEALM